MMDRLAQRVALAGAEGRGLADGPLHERGLLGQRALPPASTYVRASLAEVAAALAALTGEPHPLATTEGW